MGAACRLPYEFDLLYCLIEICNVWVLHFVYL